MALRPLIVKHAFYLPGSKGFGKGNHGAIAHLQYMGDPSRHQKTNEELLMGSASIHAKYMTERPGVSGYFGPDPRTLPDIEKIQKTLESHTGPIWRDFISVTERDAVAMGGDLMTREGWEKAARAQLPKMFQSMGLDPANVEWVASVHKKAGHPHMHLLFWEREPVRIKGQWSEKERVQIRRDWASELYRPQRERLGSEKSALRQQLLSNVKSNDLGVLPAKTQKEWTTRLSTLAEHLPSRGRKALKYMPPEVKAEAKATAEWLVTTIPAFKKAAVRYGDLAAEMARHYSDNPLSHEQSRQNAMDDLLDRVSQLIIQQAAAFPKRAMEPPEEQKAEMATIKSESRSRVKDILAAAKSGEPTDFPDADHLRSLLLQIGQTHTAMESEGGGNDAAYDAAMASALALVLDDPVVRAQQTALKALDPKSKTIFYSAQSALAQTGRAMVREQITEALNDPTLKEAIKAATKDIQNGYVAKSQAIANLTAQVRAQLNAPPTGYIDEAINQSITRRLEGRLNWFADQDHVKDLMTDRKLQRLSTEKAVDRIIATDPDWHRRYLKASITPLIVPSQTEFTRRTLHMAKGSKANLADYAEQVRSGEGPIIFPITANTRTDTAQPPKGPLLKMTPFPSDTHGPLSFSLLESSEPEGLQASLWNPKVDAEATIKRQQQVRDSLTQHVQSEKDWQARALYRHQHAMFGLSSIFSGMQSALHKAEAENHRAAFRSGSREAWIDEARAHGLSESKIAEIEMG